VEESTCEVKWSDYVMGKRKPSYTAEFKLTKMGSESLHDNSTWIHKMYEYGAIKRIVFSKITLYSTTVSG
jgi:hypothetical protein